MLLYMHGSRSETTPWLLSTIASTEYKAIVEPSLNLERSGRGTKKAAQPPQVWTALYTAAKTYFVLLA
jgi:hypothetical protein